MKIKILIADDHKIIRDGIKALLAIKKDEFEVVGEACDGKSALRSVQKLTPDVVVMDINMPKLNGIEATSQIVSENPNVKVLALSMHSSANFVQRMFRAGAAGYLLKDCAFEELVDAITLVRRNKKYISPELTNTLIDDYINQNNAGTSNRDDILTGREREVLQLIAEGWSTKKIAGSLCLSTKTIETHRRRIMEKVNAFSIAELTKYAISEGLTFVEN